MLPGDERERYRCKRAKNLRYKNNAFSAESVRQVAGGQRQGNHRRCDDQPDQPKRSCGMGARINLPFDSHGQHQTPGD